MRTILVTIVLALAACGSKSTPAPAPTPSTGSSTDPAAACNLEGPDHTPATKEQCDCMGMQSVGDIGNGQVKCPDGTIEVSKIRFGIEGGVCCAKGEPGPEAS
jgi:hypothetical protein